MIDQLEQELSQYTVPKTNDDRFITAHYYIEAVSDIQKVAEKVASHQSTAAGVFAEDTLVNRCSAKVSYVTYLEGEVTKGFAGISFPVELFGEIITSSDILHIVSGAVQNDESHHKVFYLIDLEIPEKVLSSFPGPTFGTELFTTSDLKIGTIIKPCSGLDAAEYERIVRQLVQYEELFFIKEDENFFPGFVHCPLSKRAEIAARVIKESGRNILFAPHITSPPRQLFKNLEIVASAGLKAVMFSETYYGGMFREAREYIQEKNLGLALYAHNGGICTKTKSINRVLLDRFSRLDGGDLRQTAPTGEGCYLRPLAWQRGLVEDALNKPLAGKKSTICVRAGGLDQGNLLQNLHEGKGKFENYLFLMGSAINSIKNSKGKYDVSLAIEGIREIVTLFRVGTQLDKPGEVYAYAQTHQLNALVQCLEQRYSLDRLKMVS